MEKVECSGVGDNNGFFELEVKAMSTCCTCGYSWRTGMSGSHSCSDTLLRQVAKQEAQIATMCKMLDAVTTSVSKTDTVHGLTCIAIDEFLEKEFKFFTQKQT